MFADVMLFFDLFSPFRAYFIHDTQHSFFTTNAKNPILLLQKLPILTAEIISTPYLGV